MIRLVMAILTVMVAQGELQAQSAEALDPRARVSMNPNSQIPDHISEIVGPAPTAEVYNGALTPRTLYRVEADPDAGFHWPYYLFVPEVVAPGSAVLIEPNNDGLSGAPFETHDYWAAIRNEQLFIDYGQHLGTPVLTPVFPRPLDDGRDGNLYIHAMTRAAMLHEDPRYARPDRQLLAMLDDAHAKLAASGFDVGEDALFWGFSAAGDFVTRMAVLHPERVRAVAAGGLGGLPILPVTELDGETLSFPVGVADLELITGRALNVEALRQTPVLLYQGGADENDSVREPPFTCDAFRSDSYSCEQAQWVNETFGASTLDRVPFVQDLYAEFGMRDLNSLVLPGVEHTTPPEMEARIRDFFSCVLAGESACAAGVSLSEGITEHNE
ncbi:hypothetical protein V0U79_07110 [Hyphobacterium sp. HN65]|uniref:Alpha/beta hydrolase n=1 Tax=Hyphobacterium lacteum TaxID=3116575 RepID=A0ABU7LQF5_9PROT|nr:hypothetical protein [Hyphobacterium sp. HN65]MEE2526131.1 hypothetical protein [Hyphobacterium sp. HN65]